MKKIIEFLINDYKSVSEAIHYSFKFKIQEWVILIYYIIMAPIGLILYPILKIALKIYWWILTRKVERLDD